MHEYDFLFCLNVLWQTTETTFQFENIQIKTNV